MNVAPAPAQLTFLRTGLAAAAQGAVDAWASALHEQGFEQEDLDALVLEIADEIAAQPGRSSESAQRERLAAHEINAMSMQDQLAVVVAWARTHKAAQQRLEQRLRVRLPDPDRLVR